MVSKSLSDYIMKDKDFSEFGIIPTIKVKEFIKRLKEEDEYFLASVLGRICAKEISPNLSLSEIREFIRQDWRESQEIKSKLAGDKLI